MTHRNDELQPLLDELGIGMWDVLLIGDGSGSHWNIGIGWSCVLIDRETGGRKLFYGAANLGCIATAEFLAYLLPLEWYAFRRKQRKEKQLCRVHVVTDNELLVRQSKIAREGKLSSITYNGALWAAVQDMERKGGFLFEFHWKARNEVALNRLCDIVAGNARVTVRDMEVAGASRGLLNYVYDTNVADNPALSELCRP